MSLQARLSRRIENSRRRNAKKVLMLSPEKDQCISCGRFVVAGPMGLSRHLSTHPQCSLDYSKEPSIHGGIMDAPLHHQQTNASFHAALSSVTGAHANNDHISLLPLHVEDDFVGTSSFADVDENDPLLSIAEDSTTFASNHPNSSVPMSAAEIGDAPSFSDTFKDPWSNDHDDGLELSLFSVEEKVQIDLLQTLKRLKAPMIAYDEVMKWAVRSCSEGHIFRDMPITSRKTVMDKLRGRVGLDSLTPIVKELYLPYSNCHIEVVYFSAHAVFSSLLSCPDLNQDENYIFHDPNNHHLDPFAKPSGSVLGDINTGMSYLKTYDKLIKNPEDMLLPCTLAIDKTTCDIGGGGRLSLEPIVLSYGLMKHDIRKTPAAMRVLGFINTTPVKERDSSPGVPKANTPLPIVSSSLVSDACYRVNEYHLQIDFILRESGYLQLQETGMKWNLCYRGKSFPVVLHPYVPFIVGDTEGHDTLCGHYRSRTAGVAQLCRACECPTGKSGYSKARAYPKRTPKSVNEMVTKRQFDLLKSILNSF
ncbi:hypothetical protein MHU86_22963 [Fragilaria crotonensis]|nr:hypothetical protein MHU86_22963 [Fragilaria crotonensis]